MLWITIGQSSSAWCSMTQILERFPSHKALLSVIPRETEGVDCPLCLYLHIFSLPSHLFITIASGRPLILDEPLRCHLRAAQVAAGQQFLSLLDHRYLWKKVETWNVPAAFPHFVLTPGIPAPGTFLTEVSWGRTPHKRLVLPSLVNPPCLADADAM